MLKKLFAIMTMLYAAVAFAAVDVNKATAAELDGIKGIGPGISTKILDERKKGSFKDWNDFVERVKGVGDGNAAKFSAEGLTVNGASFKGAAPAPAAKADSKPAVAATAAPAAAPAAKEEKKDPKAEAKMKAEEAKKAKAEEKAKKAEEKAKKAEEAKAKKEAKAAAPKEPASAAKK